MGFRVLGGGFQGLDSWFWDVGFTRFRFAVGASGGSGGLREVYVRVAAGWRHGLMLSRLYKACLCFEASGCGEVFNLFASEPKTQNNSIITPTSKS